MILLEWRVGDGATQMALDEAMMEPARRGSTVLRFYGWDPPCLSLGRNQPAPSRWRDRPPAELRPGVDIVRRPTGGRSVFHGPEVTYAFACPDRAWGGPRAVYRRVHRALGQGLEQLGVSLDAEPEPNRSTADHGGDLSPSAAACFRDPAPGELTVGGRKLVGSAQRRSRGALLQHGSILITNRQELGELGERRGGEPPSGIGLDEVLAEPPTADRIVRVLSRALRGAFASGESGPPASASATVGEEIRLVAARLEPRYRSAGRLWGRRPERPSRSGLPNVMIDEHGEAQEPR